MTKQIDKCKKYVFLIGGHDLEMDEIVKILKEHNCEYFDESLKWGARLSHYEKYFNDEGYKEKTFFGIELSKDCEPPVNYQGIDHHNKNKALPSSIKQVACLLSIELTREQMLISANDSGYIPALIAEGATDAEILYVRSRDRKAQGVTAEDEAAAAKSLSFMDIDGDFVVVKSLTDKFSAVTDAIYINEGEKKINRENIKKYKRLIVYNDSGINYYGDNISILEENLTGDKDADVYSGGSTCQGYFGVSLKSLNGDKICGIIADIKKILREEIKSQSDPATLSYHIFMLPFRFEYKHDLHKNVELKEIEKIFRLKDADWKNWKRTCETTGTNENTNIIAYKYSEVVFFYDFARKALFDNVDKKDGILMEFNIELDKEHINTYRISLKSGKSYILDIDSINVVFYNTNVGVLSFKLINDESGNFEDILNINDFGRRIYPQYLTLSDCKNNYNLTDVKGSFLSDSIGVNINGESLCDDFEKFSEIKYAHFWGKHEGELELMPVYIKGLFPCGFLEKYRISPIVDDRMFVMSWYVNDGVFESLKKIKCDYGEYFYNYSLDENWYQYVYVDNAGASNKNYFLKKEELSSSTYGRWIEDGSLFGATNYSFVFLGQEGLFQKNIILKHIETIYYRMVCLSLAQKATFLHFSQRINEIEDSEAIKLHKKYLDFMNSMYFNEITAQTQGIDLYNMLNDKMHLKDRVEELQRDFKELSMNVELRYGRGLNFNVLILTAMSLILLSLSTIFAFMSLHKETYSGIVFSIFHFFYFYTINQVLFDLTFIAVIIVFIIIVILLPQLLSPFFKKCFFTFASRKKIFNYIFKKINLCS